MFEYTPHPEGSIVADGETLVDSGIQTDVYTLADVQVTAYRRLRRYAK